MPTSCRYLSAPSSNIQLVWCITRINSVCGDQASSPSWACGCRLSSSLLKLDGDDLFKLPPGDYEFADLAKRVYSVRPR